MKELWTKGESEHHGRYYDFPPVYSFPKPAQRPHPPLLLGGKATNVFKRVVEWADGWMPNLLTPEEVKLGRATLNRLAEEAGRDPASIEIAVYHLGLGPNEPNDLDLIARLEDAGADRVGVRLEAVGESESLEEIERLAESVLA